MSDLLNKEQVVIPPKDEEELELEKLVFGDLEGFGSGLKDIENLYNESEDEYSGSDESESEDENDKLQTIQDDKLFFVDDGEEEDRMEVDGESDDEEEENIEESDDDAWYDSEDEGVSVSLLQSNKLKKLRKEEEEDVISGRRYISRLRSQFEKMYPRPKWADQEISENEDDSDLDIEDDNEDDGIESGDVRALHKLLQSNKDLINSKTSKLLQPSKISIVRLKDANHKMISKSAVQSISFHPTHPVLLTAGYDKTIRVFNINGNNNTVVSTVHFPKMPIQTAEFNPNSSITKVYAGGRRKYMYIWDLTDGSIDKISRLYGHEETQRSFENFKVSPKGSFIGLQGNNGRVNILSSTTGQWIQDFKVEGVIVDFDWGFDENLLIAVNQAGDIWEFNLRTKTVVKRWKDETGVGITKIKLGGKNDRWCAVGSSSGVVNIYDRSGDNKKPVGTLDQLVTSISTLEFNHDGQILCIASRARKDQLRLVHLPSAKVFQNWPTSGTPLGRVTAVKFSPNSEMICIGNDGGHARLWNLTHY